MNRSLHTALTAAISCCLVLPAAAFGANGEKTPLSLEEVPARAAESGAAGPGGGSLVRTIVGLAIVIGVIYGLHWVLKQVKASKEESQSGNGLGTVATLPLGPNRSLHLIRAGTELVLVGVGEHGVTPIRTYSESEAMALGLIEPEEPVLTLDGSAAVTVVGPARPAAAALPARIGSALNLSRVVDDLRARTVIR